MKAHNFCTPWDFQDGSGLPFRWASCHLCCFHVLCLIDAEQACQTRWVHCSRMLNMLWFCLGFVLFSGRLHENIITTNDGGTWQPWNAAGWKHVVQGGNGWAAQAFLSVLMFLLLSFVSTACLRYLAMCNLGRITFPPRNVDCSLARRIISNWPNKMYIKTYQNVLNYTE